MAGWMIGVLVEVAGAPAVRHFYAVARDDRARAEWAAADQALKDGAIASSPRDGMEPVETLGPLSARALQSLGVAPGETKGLGWETAAPVALTLIANRAAAGFTPRRGAPQPRPGAAL